MKRQTKVKVLKKEVPGASKIFTKISPVYVKWLYIASGGAYNRKIASNKSSSKVHGLSGSWRQKIW